MRSPVANIRRVPFPTGAPIPAEGEQIEFGGALAGFAVLVGIAPGIGRNGFLHIRPGPARFAGGLGHQGAQALLGRGIVAGVETVLVEGLFQGVDLRAGDFHFGFLDLGEVTRTDVAGEQADDGDHDEEFEEGEAAGFLLPGDQFDPSVSWCRRVAGTDFCGKKTVVCPLLFLRPL